MSVILSDLRKRIPLRNMFIFKHILRIYTTEAKLNWREIFQNDLFFKDVVH